MVILKFQPTDFDAGDASFEVSGENFGMACGELLQELSRRFYLEPDVDDFVDEMFAEVFPVLEELAEEENCDACREDLSTPEQNYKITRRTVKPGASPVVNVKPFIAAPDILAALIACRDRITELTNDRDSCWHDWPLSYQVDLAIAKAEGK